MFDKSSEVIDAYMDSARALDAQYGRTPDRGRIGSNPHDVRLLDVRHGGDFQQGRGQTGGTLRVCVTAQIDRERAHLVDVGVNIIRNDGTRCFGVTTSMDAARLYPLGGDRYGIGFVVDELSLLSGIYSLDVSLSSSQDGQVYDRWTDVAPFKVWHDRKREDGLARLEHYWERP